MQVSLTLRLSLALSLTLSLLPSCWHQAGGTLVRSVLDGCKPRRAAHLPSCRPREALDPNASPHTRARFTLDVLGRVVRVMRVCWAQTWRSHAAACGIKLESGAGAGTWGRFRWVLRKTACACTPEKEMCVSKIGVLASGRRRVHRVLRQMRARRSPAPSAGALNCIRPSP